jgi:hypothetical protein
MYANGNEKGCLWTWLSNQLYNTFCYPRKITIPVWVDFPVDFAEAWLVLVNTTPGKRSRTAIVQLGSGLYFCSRS